MDENNKQVDISDRSNNSDQNLSILKKTTNLAKPRKLKKLSKII